MERIQICGSSGAGETTLARLLAQGLDMPCVDLDDLYWEPGWREAPGALFAARPRGAIAGPRWVIAGNYLDVAAALAWPRLTMLVVLDLPFPVLLWRSLVRTIWRSLTGQSCCNGNQESLRRLFHRDGVVRYLVRTCRARRARYGQLATLAELRHVRVVHLRHSAGVAAFAAQAQAIAGGAGTL